MATMYFSGVEKAETARILRSVPGSAGMISFWEYSPGLFAVCEASGLRLTFDSGAYTRPLTSKDIECYASVICALGDGCEWYANADVIGNQRRSDENYRALLSLLPPALRHKVLWVYQVSAPLAHLDEGLERFERIGVGGLIPLLAQDRNGAQLLAVAHHIARKPVEPHYFGLGQLRWLRRLGSIHQGRFSCDSSAWLIGAKYGLLIRNDGKQITAKKTGFDFTTAEILAQNVRTMRKWVEIQGIVSKDMHSVLQLPLFS